MGVLGADALDCIDQQQDHIRPLDRLEGSQHAELLHAALDLAAPPNAGGVDEGHGNPWTSMMVSTASRVVPATGLTMERSFPTSRLSRLDLPGVGLADNGDLDALVFRGLRVPQAGNQVVQEIADVRAVNGRDRMGLPQSKLVELHGGCSRRLGFRIC